MIFNSNTTPALVRHIMGFIMVAVYLGLGLLFLVTDLMIDNFPLYRTQLGIVMIVYALFRTFLLIRKLRKHND